MYPWQKSSKDDRRTNKNSKCQLIDIVELVTGGVIDSTIAADVMHGLLAFAGGVRIRRRICERLVLRGGTRIGLGLILGAI